MKVKKSLYIFFIIWILNFYNNQNLDPIHDSLRISIAFSLFLRSSWSLHSGRCSINVIKRLHQLWQPLQLQVQFLLYSKSQGELQLQPFSQIIFRELFLEREKSNMYWAPH